MFDKISLKALCAYEKLTGKNAMELFAKESKSATDLRDLVFVIKYSKNNAITFDDIENMSGKEFEDSIKSVNETA
jgi:hypothetical protein